VKRRVLVVAALIERGDEVLVARRRPVGERAHLWEFPGGKVEAEEGERALYRASLHGGQEPRPLAAQEIRWAKRRELPGLPFCEADVPLLVRVAEEG
jgi:hypothetical protein